MFVWKVLFNFAPQTNNARRQMDSYWSSSSKIMISLCVVRYHKVTEKSIKNHIYLPYYGIGGTNILRIPRFFIYSIPGNELRLYPPELKIVYMTIFCTFPGFSINTIIIALINANITILQIYEIIGSLVSLSENIHPITPPIIQHIDIIIGRTGITKNIDIIKLPTIAIRDDTADKMQNYNLTATSKRCTSVNAYSYPIARV